MSTSSEKSFKVDQLQVRRFDVLPEMATAAAEDAANVLREAVARRGSARAIIATGNSQDLFLAKLVALPGIEWGKIALFHMDEYLGMPMTHPASFRKYLK